MSVSEKWFCVTQDFGLIEAPIQDVAQTYKSWWAGLGYDLITQTCKGSLDDKLGELEPFSFVMNRTLLLPTSTQWTAFFRNGVQGSDPASALPVLAERLSTRAIRICSTGSSVKYPATILTVYDSSSQLVGTNNTQRSIGAANDGGRWVFQQYGDPYHFEKTERYAARSKRNRFDHGLLLEYLENFGVGALGDELLDTGSDNNGVLMSRPFPDRVEKYTRLEVRAGLPWQK